MNREIKFRAFATDLKKTVYGYLVDDVEWAKTWIYYPIKKGAFIEMYSALVDKKTVGQFTGLTDKNGKEIYEGDVINTVNNNWGVIVVKDHCFEVTVSETQSSFYTAEWMKQSEVIGNIYENENLLK